MELANALDHEMQAEIAAKWRAVVNATEFLQNVVAAVRIRKTMDEASLESHVAYSAGQPKTPAVTTGARTVVEILATAGVLKEDDSGSLIAVTPERRPIAETVVESLSISDPQADHLVHFSGHGSPSGTRFGGVQLNIDVRVQCTPSDLDTLGQKLRKVLKDFNEPAQSPQTSQVQPSSEPPTPPALPATPGNAAE